MSVIVRRRLGADRAFGRMCLLAPGWSRAGAVRASSSTGTVAATVRKSSTNAAKIDRPIAGLIADLKQRGLV